MGIVKGPYSKGDWLTMLAYKESLPKLMKKNGESGGRYQSLLDKDTFVLKTYLQKQEEDTEQEAA